MKDKKRVLLIDDDRDFLQSNKQLLEAEGFEVHTANTGASGIAKAKAIRPNLIVLDVMMESEREGFAVNSELRGTPGLEDVPVIMLSGINEKLDLPYRFDSERGWPCVAFIEKPPLPEELLAKVKEHAA